MRPRLRIFAFLSIIAVIVVLVFFADGPALAADLYVDDDPGCGGNSPCYSTIQAAIDAAETGDAVRVANGTYRGTGNRAIDFKGKVITVQSEGGPAVCIIDVEETFNRGFIFQNGEGAGSVLSGFTITHGNHFNGAGIYCYAAFPTITNCHFIENVANNDGGGIYIDNSSSPEITACLFSNNTANRWGGGIYSNDSCPAISNCQFNNNSANTMGGGVYCDNSSSANITDCSFSNNTANLGGGIACRSSSPVISNSTLGINTANLSGGGIYCESASPEISSCEITGNTASQRGGGIHCGSDSNPNISNCIIETNSANGTGGGGIYSIGSSPTISNSSISGNSAPSGSGGGVFGDSSPFSISFCDLNDNVASQNGGGICCLTSAPTINICTVSNNTAGFGGGIYLDSSAQTSEESTIINLVLITGNTAEQYGGGVYVNYSYAWITNCVISENSAEFGGGIRCMNNLSPATNNQPAIINCILHNNTADYGAGVDLYRSIATITNSTFYANMAVEGGGVRHYIYSTATVFPIITNTILWNDSPSEITVITGPIFVMYSNVQGGYTGTGTNNINSDPLFVDPASNDFHLGAGSPCIDAATSNGALVFDLEGTFRWDDPATPNTGAGVEPYYDIGAYEYYPRCAGDCEPDGDVDGYDLAEYVEHPGGISLGEFAGNFGRDDCL